LNELKIFFLDLLLFLGGYSIELSTKIFFLMANEATKQEKSCVFALSNINQKTNNYFYGFVFKLWQSYSCKRTL